MRANIGCTRNSSQALRKTVAEKSRTKLYALPSPWRAPRIAGWPDGHQICAHRTVECRAPAACWPAHHQEDTMNKALTLLMGFGMGMGLMFLLDPDRGRRRRALMRDQAV